MSFFFSARARIRILSRRKPEPASRNASQVKAAERRRGRGPPVSRRSPAIAGRRRKRRAVREAGRRRDDEEREKESPARLRADASPRQARSVTPEAGPDFAPAFAEPPARQARLRRASVRTARPPKAARVAAGGCSEQGKRATSARPPPSVRAFSPDARRPPPGGRRKRSPAPAGRAQAARPSAAPCQARRPAGRGVWERRAWRAACSSSRTRHDKPGATGEDACTRDNGSGGPVTGRSGGTTDDAGTGGTGLEQGP